MCSCWMTEHRAWTEKTSYSLLRAMTMIMRRACQHLQKRTSSTPCQPTGALLDLSRLLSVRTAEMKIVGTSPPKHKHLLSASHGVARCLRTREARLSPRRCNCTVQPQPLCILDINGNSTFSRRRHQSSSFSTDGPRRRSQHPFQSL